VRKLSIANSVFRTRARGPRFRALGLASAMAIAFVAPVLARSHVRASAHGHLYHDNLSAAERYAWEQIKQGLPANFNEECDDWLDPKQGDDPGWRDENKCRTLRATFVADILTRPPLRDSVHYKGIDIHGAKIVGNVDLSFGKIDRPIHIIESRFEGSVSLRNARVEGVVLLDSSVITGQVDATELHSDGDLSLRRTAISEEGLRLDRATIAGVVDMTGATCMGDLDANSLQTTRDLLLGNGAKFKNVRLGDGNIGGAISLVGASFDGDFIATGVQATDLLMHSQIGNKTRFKNVYLNHAKVTGEVALDGSLVGGNLTLNTARVDGSLFLRSDNSNKANFKTIDLRGATVSGEVDMSGSNFNGDIDARSLRVGGSLFITTDLESKNRFGRVNKTVFSKLNLKNAKVGGQLDMSGVSFNGDLYAPFIQIGGSLLMRSTNKIMSTFKNVELSGANVTGQIDMTGASFDGDLNADSLQVGESLLMNAKGASKTSFKKVTLRGAKISGQVDMGGASFEGDFDARFMQVGGALLMGSQEQYKLKSSFEKVDLRSAKISGEFSLAGARLNGDLYAPFLQVGGSMFMRSRDGAKANFKTVEIANARIAGQIDFSGANLDGDLNADFVQVGGSLFMSSEDNNTASVGKVNLNGANVAGGTFMDRAILRDRLIAQGLRVGGDVSLRHIHADGRLGMPFSQLGGNLDIGGSDLTSLDLHGAAIAGEMRLGDGNRLIGWRALLDQPDAIDLRNAHVGSLSDNKYSWPKRLYLDGVSFVHFGGAEGDSGADMVKRGADWWDRNFARLEKDFTASPYEQLATAFGGAGYRDLADELHYDEQLRATEKSSILGIAGSALMRWGAGYGIGSYMFRALYWVIGLSLIGALILRFRVKGVADRNHGFLWCFGAAANKLLPGISLKKEFADFFDDPANNKFTPRQELFFVILTALGWALSLIVLAAFAALTHGP
jgi:cytoskeletal protein CcmA (bactofilin family)